MTQLASEKKAARENVDLRRRRFHDQDSFLKETFNTSQVWYQTKYLSKLKIHNLKSFCVRMNNKEQMSRTEKKVFEIFLLIIFSIFISSISLLSTCCE